MSTTEDNGTIEKDNWQFIISNQLKGLYSGFSINLLYNRIIQIRKS